MVIALVVTIVALVASNYARAAFFHLSEINNRVNELQAQADELDKHVHQDNVVVIARRPGLRPLSAAAAERLAPGAAHAS